MKGVGKQFVPLKRKDNGVVKTDAGVYRSSIGCLLYLIATMPDIMLVASLFSWFMQSQNEKFNWDDGSVKTDVGFYWGSMCGLLTQGSCNFQGLLITECQGGWSRGLYKGA